MPSKTLSEITEFAQLSDRAKLLFMILPLIHGPQAWRTLYEVLGGKTGYFRAYSECERFAQHSRSLAAQTRAEYKQRAKRGHL